MKKLVIDQYDDHQRIDKYLKKVLVQAPSSLIYKMLRKKDVKVNGKRVKENYILHSGDEVELFLYEDKFKEYTKPLTVYELPITFKVVYPSLEVITMFFRTQLNALLKLSRLFRLLLCFIFS